MSKFHILAENQKKSRRRESRGGDERTVRVAALRAQRDEERRGNDAPWKAWKTQKASFPLFPPGLEIRPKTEPPDFHISTAPAAAFISSQKNKNEPENKFQLTDLGQFKHDKNASVASLRS